MANKNAQGDTTKSSTVRFNAPSGGSRLTLDRSKMSQALEYFEREGSSIQKSLADWFIQRFGGSGSNTWENIGNRG